MVLLDARIAQLRVQETLRMLDLAGDRLSAWTKDRRDRDVDARGEPRGKHESQLKALELVVQGAVDDLRKSLKAPTQATTLDLGEVYDRCRAHDVAVVWTRRVWEFFRDKLDQRDLPELARALRGADEVIFSSYAFVFDKTSRRTPPPLAYCEPRFVPGTLEADKVPGELRLDADLAGVEASLQLTEIPIPLISVPPWCVDAPWWLVHLGHETGHHALRELRRGAKFQAELRNRAEKAYLGQVEAVSLADRWAGWSNEIFADLYAVLVMGPYAIHALMENVLARPARMAAPSPLYPPAKVRLELMSSYAKRLGFQTVALDFGEVAWPPSLELWRPVIDAVVELAGTNDGLADLEQGLLPRGPSHFMSQVGKHADLLAANKPRFDAEPTLDSARYAVCGAVQAWQTLRALPELKTDEWPARMAGLVEATLVALDRATEVVGVRASKLDADELATKGQTLARSILARLEQSEAPDA